MSPAAANKRKLRSTAAPTTHHIDRRAGQLLAVESADNKINDDDLLTTVQVAAWLGVSIQFLEIGRAKKYGPAFTKLAPRCVRYRRGDVKRWLQTRTHASTAEYKQAEVA